MKLLRHPEITIPASLFLLIGSFFVVLQFAAGHDFQNWAIAFYLIGSGLLILKKENWEPSFLP
jgi:hypothetical protein